MAITIKTITRELWPVAEFLAKSKIRYSIKPRCESFPDGALVCGARLITFGSNTKRFMSHVKYVPGSVKHCEGAERILDIL